MAPPKSPDEARANDIAQKSESMARELSQKREMRIRQERVRHLSSDDAPAPSSPSNKDAVPRVPRTPAPVRSPNTRVPTPAPDDKTVRAEDNRIQRAPVREVRPEVRDTRVEPPPSQGTSPPFYPDKKPSMLDDVATELEELLRDQRASWRRFEAADKITFVAAAVTLVGVLMPWISDGSRGFQLGIVAGGAFHAALATVAIALVVGRSRRYDQRGERLGGRERQQRARRASLWHLMLGAASTVLCVYFLVVYGMQRGAVPGLEIRFGLYVTLAAGMGLSYGGFARFFSRHHE